jgi:hypothetical protein
MADRLRAAGTLVELALLAGLGHRYGPDGNDHALARTIGFVDGHLQPAPERYREGDHHP